MKTRGHIISNIILILALVVLAASLFKIISGQNEYREGRDVYERVREDAKTKDGNGINWKKLKKQNPDIVGWIRFKNPKEIDYPIVQGEDNSIYLYKAFSQDAIKAGTIFINCDNRKDFSDMNTIIYGHNMNDGSMFAKLRQYQDLAFYRENPKFKIYTPDGKTHYYTIFAAGTYPTDSNPASLCKLESKKEFSKLLKEILKGRAYKTEVDVDKNDRIVTLYTCTNISDAERWLVFGVETKVK